MAASCPTNSCSRLLLPDWTLCITKFVQLRLRLFPWLIVSLYKHWILDGFPRTVGQGQMLDAHLRLVPSRTHELCSCTCSTCATPLNLVVNLDVSDDVILSRITDRWVHTPSGRVYNLSYNPPRQPGRDDITGEPLVQRPDDTPVRISSL
jgi:adenylate kinase family enzyme